MNENEATGLNTPHESLMFESFQMCSLCYNLTKNSPELVEANKKLYHEKLVAKEQVIAEEVKSKRFRVWLRGDYAKYAESITGKPFYGFDEGGHKCKVLLKKESADEVVRILKSKLIESWIVEEEP